MKKKKICYYVTSHGYGHAVRTVAVCNRFLTSVDLTLRTSLARTFFDEELTMDFRYCPAEFDCGCLQSDGVTVDIGATVERYTRLSQSNHEKLHDETRWLRSEKFDLVVSDSTPFAFEAARLARVKSCALTNFTWYDIYEQYSGAYPDFLPVVQEVREQYRMADMLVEAAPALPMTYFRDRKSVHTIGARGTRRESLLRGKLGIERDVKIGLIYVGTFGMERAQWRQLESFRNWFFVGMLDLPVRVSNYAPIGKDLMSYRDLAASVDCTISKIGYGTYADCLLNGVSLVYLPRTDFAEYPFLEKGVLDWGYGIPLSQDAFYALQWRDALDIAVQRERPVPVDDCGAREAAAIIEEL